MKRISLVGPTHPFRGGIAHYTTLLCRALREHHEVQFLSFRRQYPAWLYPAATDRDQSASPVTVDHVEHVIDALLPTTWLAAARRIGAFEPDILIIPWWVAYWAPLCLTLARRARPRGELVFLCHNSIEHESNRLKVLATRRVLRQADRVVTHSVPERDRLRDLLGAGVRVEAAYHPTYAGLCDEAPPRAEARAALQLPDTPVLLFFGFVRDYKGLDTLLDAMPLIREHSPVTLVVAGEFWKGGDRYQAQIDSLGLRESVRLHNHYIPNEDIGQYFAAADLVVQPYRSATGSGITQLAYGFGKPVIATHVGGIPDVIQDGVNGRLVPPENPHALAAAVVEALDPPTLQGLTREAAQVRKRFSWDGLVNILVAETPST